MKTLTTIIFAVLALFGYNPLIAQSNQKSEQDTICFSKEKFEEVYQYIDKQINDNNALFLTFEDSQIYLEKDKRRISLKKDGYTYAKIDAQNGVFSLNKSAKNNKKWVKRAHEVFCKLCQKINHN